MSPMSQRAHYGKISRFIDCVDYVDMMLLLVEQQFRKVQFVDVLKFG